MKTLINLLFATLFITCVTAEANPYPYRGSGIYAPPPDYQAIGPAHLLEEGLNRMRDFLAQGGADNPADLYTFLQEQVTPYFDFERMAAWVAKPYYQRMTQKQQIRFRNNLQEVFLKTLAKQIGAFSKPKPRIDFLRPRAKGPNEISVSARVLPANGYPIRLTFRFWRGKEGWKVVDASANGTSAVHYYRQKFLENARRSGLQSTLR